MAKSSERQNIEASDAVTAKTEKIESVYSAAELAKAHKTFNTSHEIVATALKLAGKKTATITEAKNIIEDFKKKEVK